MSKTNLTNEDAEYVYDLFAELVTEQLREEFHTWLVKGLQNPENYIRNSFLYHDRLNGLSIQIITDDEGNILKALFFTDWVSPVSIKSVNEANNALKERLHF